MKYQLFSRVALHNDLPLYHFKRGDIGTIVEQLEGKQGQEDGYCIEMFDVLGNTLDVIVVRESEIDPLCENEIPNARHFEHAVA